MKTSLSIACVLPIASSSKKLHLSTVTEICFIKTFLTALTILLFTASCQKEIDRQQQVADGTLMKDASGNCLSSTVSGVYKEDSLLTGSHFVDVQVEFTQEGSYIIASDTINGYSFSGEGIINAPGVNTVRLAAFGSPIDAGTNSFTITYNSPTASSSCSIDVTVLSVDPLAIFTLGGAGSSCTGFMSAGTYAPGSALGASNTISLNVNVTSVGAYTINTESINGVTFSSTGIFTTTGVQLVTLTGSGTPTAAGPITHIVNAGTNPCSFSITYAGAASQAMYTLSNASGVCVYNVSGIYTVGTALTGAHSLSLQVNVSTIGTYTLTTGQVNGITFSKTGTFTVAGLQMVVLNGSGTPVAGGISTFTLLGGSSSCSFNLTVNSGPADFIIATVDGVTKTFNVNPLAYLTSGTQIAIVGRAQPASVNLESVLLYIDLRPQPGVMITTTSYDMSGASLNTYQLAGEYFDPPGVLWKAQAAHNDPFTITITSLTANRTTGTFSGTVRNQMTNASTKVVTNGSFSVRIQ